MGQRPSKLEEAGRSVTKAWTACMNDRRVNRICNSSAYERSNLSQQFKVFLYLLLISHERRSSNLFGGPKRSLGTYYLATLLFKIYFRVRILKRAIKKHMPILHALTSTYLPGQLQTLGLCKNIVRGIQNQTDLPPLSNFPRSHQVTYRFYLGVFAFLNERYQDAETELVFAYNNGHVRARKNQE